MISSGLTTERIEALARGETRPVSSEEQALRLTSAQLVEFEKAKRSGFVTLRGRRPKLRNAYYRWCQSVDRPFVSLAPRQRYGTVELQVPSVPGLPASTMARIGELLRSESVKGHAGAGTSEYAYGESIPIERAEKVARQVYDLAGGERLELSSLEEIEEYKEAGRRKSRLGRTPEEQAEGVLMEIRAHWCRNPGPRFEEYASHWLWANKHSLEREVADILVKEYPTPERPRIRRGFSDWGAHREPASGQ